MDGAQLVAEGGAVGQPVDAAVGTARVGRVPGGQGNPRRHQDHEGHQGGAAQGVPPVGVRGDRMLDQRAEGGGDAGAVLEPVGDAAEHQTLLVIATGLVRISTWPFRTRTGYFCNGLGGGPAATVPSL